MKKLSILLIISLITCACALIPALNDVDQAAVKTVVAAELTLEIQYATEVPTSWSVPTFAPPIAVTPKQVTPFPTDPIPTPIPSLTIGVPTSVPQIIKKSGANDAAVPVPEMIPGYQFIGFTNTGDLTFTIFTCDEAGNRVGVLVDTTGPYTGWQLLSPDAVIPRFDVISNGEWSIELRPDTKDAAPKVTAPAFYHGEGDTVLAISCCLEHKPDVADFAYPGEANFAVYSTSKSGERQELINQQGPYSGQLVMPARLAFLEIRATGGWDMNMTEKSAE